MISKLPLEKAERQLLSAFNGPARTVRDHGCVLPLHIHFCDWDGLAVSGR